MGQLLLPLTLLLAFVAVVLVAQAVVHAVFGKADQARRVNLRLSMIQAGRERREVYETLARKRAPREASDGWHRKLEALCTQAGLKGSPIRLVQIAAAVAGAIWIFALVFLSVAKGGAAFAEALVALAAAVALSSLGTWGWVARRRAQRLKRLEAQLPLALDVVIRGLKAGHPVISAVQLVTEEMGDPLGTEFGLIVDETTYGLEFKDALTNFARRTGSEDAFFFAVSVGIQTETGGNLAEVLANLASIMRSRASLAKRVKALSSEGKASAWVLSVLPAVCIAGASLMSPGFYTGKFDDPLFWPIVGAVVGLYAIGLLTISRIVNIKY